MSELVWSGDSPYSISIYLGASICDLVMYIHNCKQSLKVVQNVHSIVGCIAHLCHLPGLDQVGHSPQGNQWECCYPELGPNEVRSPVLPLPIIPLHLFPLDGRKRVGNGGSWWLIHRVTSGALKILGKVPSHGWWVPHTLGLSRICLSFPSLPSPPSTCGSCPFIWHSGLVSKVSFCLVHFGHFVNHPPGPEIYFVYLTACPMLELHQVSLAGEGF